MKKILHILPIGSYRVYEFLKFMNENFSDNDHDFFIVATKKEVINNDPRLLAFNNLMFYPDDFSRRKFLRHVGTFLYFKRLFSRGELIIWHSFSHLNIAMLLVMALSNVLKKSIWIEHGYDLYFWKNTKSGWKWKIKNFLFKYIREHVKTIAVTVPSDRDIYQRIFNRKVVYRDIVVPINSIYMQEANSMDHKKCQRNILMVGFDGKPSSKHSSILKILKRFPSNDYSILLPMGFGLPWQYEQFTNRQYNKNICEMYRKELKATVNVLETCIDSKKYFSILNSVTSYICMGARPKEIDMIIYAICMKKKLYLELNSPIEKYLRDLGIITYDSKSISNLDSIFIADEEVLENNKRIINEVYNKANILEKWKDIYEIGA